MDTVCYIDTLVTKQNLNSVILIIDNTVPES